MFNRDVSSLLSHPPSPQHNSNKSCCKQAHQVHTFPPGMDEWEQTACVRCCSHLVSAAEKSKAQKCAIIRAVYKIMLTQLQEKCFYQHSLFQLGFKEEAVWKSFRSSFTCTPTFTRVQIMHKVCGIDRAMGSIEDRSCKFGSGCPEKRKPLTVLTDSPFSCQHWPGSTPRMSFWLLLSLSDITDVMWSQNSFCKECTRSPIPAAGRAHRVETEQEHKNHNVHMEFDTAGHTQPTKTGSNVEEEFFCCRRGICVGPGTCSAISDAANATRLSCT